MHTAEVISIGDELTSGQRLDTNSQWLSLRLGELGIRVLYHTTVADDLEANCRVFQQAIDRADVVVATGGLGPTADDLTREALAAVAGVDLVQDDESLKHIRALFARRGREMPERNVVQALFPQGSRPIPNPHGTAPGIEMIIERSAGSAASPSERRTSNFQRPTSNESQARSVPSTLDVGSSTLDVQSASSGFADAPVADVCHVFCLPGVPAEMKEMWPSVAAALQARGLAGRIMLHRTIRCFGVGESDLEQMLPDLIRRGREPQVGITVSGATISLRMTACGADAEECAAALERTAAIIQQCLGTLVFGEEEEELQHAVLRLLAQKERTLGLVEWGSGGQIAWWLRELPESQRYVPGGVVIADATGATRMLDVPEDVLAGGLRRREVAESLALMGKRRLGTDYVLAVGPYPDALSAGDDDHFHVALATPDGMVAQSPRYVGHPELINTLAAKRALDLVRLTLLKVRDQESGVRSQS